MVQLQTFYETKAQLEQLPMVKLKQKTNSLITETWSPYNMKLNLGT